MIALVFCGDLKYCPYINRYVERIENAHVDYKVYFWNRGGYELSIPENYVYYQCASDLEKGKLGKLYDFVKFRFWIIDTLKKDKPQKIVLLSTLTGILLSNYVLGLKIPYIFDIRDYSYEYIKLFYKIEESLIKNSVFTAISSKGFELFLPKHNYVVAHNFNRNDARKNYFFQKSDGKINFVWNGSVRYFEYQKQYLDALKNDERFNIVFHGDGPDLNKYRNYCKKKGFNNVFFTGEYDNSFKAELLNSAHILNNCYGYLENSGGNKLKYAVSNRFYDGIIYHIPQLVEPEGHKTDLVLEIGVGASVQADEFFADNLYRYYRQIDGPEFDEACNTAFESILADDDLYINEIDRFIVSNF